MYLRILMGSVAALLLFSRAANAAVYSFDSSALGISATITTSDTLDSSGGYDILDIRGSLAGFPAIVGLAANPANPGTIDLGGGDPFLYDNILFTNDPHFDALGVAFQLANGQLGIFACVGSGACDSVVNGTAPSDYELVVGNSDGGFDIDASGSAILTAVPEPATWSMLMLGFAGLCLFRLRSSRRKSMLV
jgi:hypothetical protein